ncbi:MAG: 3TM-type holin [Hyphomicrobiales bacterium]
MLLSALIGLVNGPVYSIIDKLIPDPDLKIKLKAEIRRAVIASQPEIAKSQRDVVLAEYKTESWLTRNWRSCLMFLAMFVLFL